MTETIKFSEFLSGGTLAEGNVTVGLSGGSNARFTASTQFQLPGTTAERPDPATNGMIRYNTDLSLYEFYNGVTWTQFEDSADIALLIARLAAHTAGDGASMIGLEDQGAVSSKTVQDLAEADFIVKSVTTSLANAIALSGLSTGILVNETGTGNLVARTITGTTDQVDVADGTGLSGNPTLSIASNPTLPGSSHVIIPFGTTAQRPGVPSNGYLRYNTDLDALEYYDTNAAAWVQPSDSGVQSVTGTTNQIDVGGTAADPVLSLSSTIQFPGTTGYANGSGILDENSNEQILFNTTASAVNYLDVTNAATGSGPLLQAAGSDTNIDLRIQAKGTGNVLFDGSDVICGDPGTEASGINVNGVTYNSNVKSSEIGATNLAQFIMHRHSTTASPIMLSAHSNSDTSAHGVVTNSMNLFSNYASGWTGTSYSLFGGFFFDVDSTGTVSTTSAPGRWRVQVTPDGSLAPATALTITNDKTATFAGSIVGINADIDNININGNTISSTDTDGDINITPDGTGDLVLDGLKWPQADGTIGQALTTDGAGQTAWSTISSGGGGDVAVGTIFSYGGTSAPTGALVCDGSAVNRTTYSELFTAIGTTWGVGDGSTTFNLPNFERKVAVGSGGTGTATLGNAVGDTGGEEDHTITTTELPANTINYSTATLTNHIGSNTGAAGYYPALNAATWNSNGGGAANIMQPSNVVLMCIQYQPNATTAASAASQAEMEAATSNTVFSTPGRQQLHPGHPKAWVVYDQATGPSVRASYNVTSVTDSGTGLFIVNWSTDFSSTDYACTGTSGSSGGGNYPIVLSITNASTATGSASFIVQQQTAVLDRDGNSVAAFGDQ